jgi:putative salt-induced outer membrane protein YdiY
MKPVPENPPGDPRIEKVFLSKRNASQQFKHSGVIMRKQTFLFMVLPFFLSVSHGMDTVHSTWNNRIGFNTSLQKGNSSTLGIGGDLKINRNNPWKNEWTFTAGGMYQKDHDQVINQSAETALRFAWSITRTLYNFYRAAVHHNKINGISRQFLPTTGVGYWLSDSKSFKWLVETGGGYNAIAYYGDSSSSEPVLQARLFAEYAIFENVTVGNNTYYFPAQSMHLIKSSSYFTLRVKQLAAKFELFMDYNSRPVSDLKAMDYHLKSGIEYSF